MKNIQEYELLITDIIKDNKRYNKGMALMIKSLADTLHTLDLCSQEIDELERVTIVRTSRYGEQLVPHPVFKIQKDAQDILMKNCKQLGLTYEDLNKVMEEETGGLGAFMAALQRKSDERQASAKEQ